MENENENEILLKKLQFFREESISIHVAKKDGRFHNGKVLEVAGDLLILDDEKQGAIPISFLEIKFVDKREVKE